MVKYAAFLRGIGPGDPVKSNESLRGAFEKMGFENVRSFISSGNILFESDEANTEALEKRIEDGLEQYINLIAPTIVKSGAQLQTFLQTKPFGKYSHTPTTYLTVTFIKTKPSHNIVDLQKDAKDKNYNVLGYDKTLRAVCSMTDQTDTKTTNFMVWLERQFGKDITTRTINTIERVAAKLQ